MSETPKKRPWFQFSLMTAVIMMLAAGGLLGLNVHAGNTDRIYTYGWPVQFYIYYDEVFAKKEEWNDLKWYSVRFHLPLNANTVNWFPLAIDAIVIASFVSLGGLICESLVRRHDRRKQAKREASKP